MPTIAVPLLDLYHFYYYFIILYVYLTQQVAY